MTMPNLSHTLIIEDEPLMINSLEKALELISESETNIDFKISTAKDCDSGLVELEKAIHGIPLDLVLLDISIPPSTDKTLLCGEDLGQRIRSFFPKVKIVAFTSYKDNYRLNSILKSLNPEGFIIKSDIDFKGLIEALTTVIFDPPFYSKVILKLIRKHLAHDFILDKVDRQLLYQLSKGTKNKDLPKYLLLSKGGIERRKRNLKEVFDIVDGDDKALISIAEEKGFI